MRIRRPTPSGVVIGAVVVLIVTATTATAAKLITSADIKDGTVASVDLKNEDVKSADINAGAVGSSELKNEDVKSADINAGAVASSELKNNSVASVDILDGTIAAADLSNSLRATVELGTFGPVHLVDQPDTGCATDDPSGLPWAMDTEDRLYSVEPAEDGAGFIVTRHDLNGTFTTVTGAQHPGCTDADPFVAPTESGTWNAVWTRKVTGNFDYDPEAALPSPPSFDSFITAVFTDDDGGAAPTVTEVSYEFDYYLPCAPAGQQHWRDQNYLGTISGEGTIGDC
jgi:hypothetical protein